MSDKTQRARIEVPRGVDPLLLAQAIVGTHLLVKAEYRESSGHHQLALVELQRHIDDLYVRFAAHLCDRLREGLDDLAERSASAADGGGATHSLSKAVRRKRSPIITTRRLQELAALIRKHHSALAFSLTGDAAEVDKALLARLVRSGVLPREAIKIVDDAYILGHVLGHAKNIDPATFSYRDFKNHVSKHPIGLTPRDEHAMTFARHNAATYIRGLGNRIADDFTTEAIETEREQREKMESEIREGLEENIHAAEAWRKLASDLGHRTKDWARDLRRIAATEKQRAMQEGYARGLRRREGNKKPHQIRVAKIPAPNACPHCRRLHLAEGNKPRVFTLAELHQNGTNVGRKAADWRATVGPVHPWCACELVHVPEGWEFDDGGVLMPADRASALDTDLRKALSFGDSVPEKGVSIRVNDPVIREEVERVLKLCPPQLFDKKRGVTLITTDTTRPESRLDEHDLAYWTGNEIRLHITLPKERIEHVLKHELGHALNVWLIHKLGSTQAVRDWHDKLFEVSEREGFVSEYAKKLPIENAAECTRLYLFERPRMMLRYPRQFSMCYDAYKDALR